MRRHNLILSLALAASLLISCKDDNGETRTVEEIETEETYEFTKEGELSLIKSGGDTIQRLDIEFAENRYEQETGLMYRESMEDNQGMLFIYTDEKPRSFYMKNTYISLDIIFYDSDSTAVSIAENAEPENETSITSEEAAKYVLEINAGLVEEWGIEEGDKIYFEKTE